MRRSIVRVAGLSMLALLLTVFTCWGVLAMYYFENMRLAEIAAVFSLTESRICQIHAQTVIGLRAYISRVRNR